MNVTITLAVGTVAVFVKALTLYYTIIPYVRSVDKKRLWLLSVRCVCSCMHVYLRVLVFV